MTKKATPAVTITETVNEAQAIRNYGWVALASCQ